MAAAPICHPHAAEPAAEAARERHPAFGPGTRMCGGCN